MAPFGLIYLYAFVSSSKCINIPNIYDLWKPMHLTTTGNISHRTLALSSLHGARVRAYLLPPLDQPSPTNTRSAQSLTADLRGAVRSDGIPMSIRNTAFRGATNAKSHLGTITVLSRLSARHRRFSGSRAQVICSSGLGSSSSLARFLCRARLPLLMGLD